MRYIKDNHINPAFETIGLMHFKLRIVMKNHPDL